VTDITVCLLPYAAVSKRPAKETVITVCSRVQETCQRRIAKDVLPCLARPAPSVRPLCPPPLPAPSARPLCPPPLPAPSARPAPPSLPRIRC
jgi:hypothetical protein